MHEKAMCRLIKNINVCGGNDNNAINNGKTFVNSTSRLTTQPLFVRNNNNNNNDQIWFDLTMMLMKTDITIDEILTGTVNLIPQFCKVDNLNYCASISWDNTNYFSTNYIKEALWCYSVVIPVFDDKDNTGRIDIYRLPLVLTPKLYGPTSSSDYSWDDTITTTSPEGSVDDHFVQEEEIFQGRDDEQAITSRILRIAELIKFTIEQRTSSSSSTTNQQQQIENEFFTESTDLHCVIDLHNLSFKHTNPAWMRILGWSQDEMIGKNPSDFLHPDDNWCIDDVKTSPSTSFQCRFRAKNNSYIWLHWSIVPSKDRLNLLATGRDITEDKEVQIALKKSEMTLKESQNIARLGQWELDLTNNNLYWSDEIYRLFRIDKEKFGASYEAFLNAVHPDDRDDVNSAYTTSLVTKKPYEITHRLLFHDGTIRYVNEMCRTEYDSSTGVALRSIGTVQDITALIKAKEDLRIAKEKAEESDRLKSAFLANMSHEIRTPMNAVIGYTDLMLTECDSLPSIYQEYLQTIKDSGTLLLTLINDILDISKIEAGQMRVERKPFSLRSLISTTQSNAKALLSRQGKGNGQVELKCPCSNDNFRGIDDIEEIILGDFARMQQILNNLISNAIKFTDTGTIEYNVKLLVDESSSSSRKMLEFSVVDTGVGIPVHEQENVFEPFRQAHGANKSHELGGSGLGLSIARKLLGLMGGEIRLESRTEEADHGSSFYFTIPYEPVTVPLVEHVSTIRKVKSQSNVNLSGKILIVDDSKINLKLVERTIVKMGCRCVTAVNGVDAVSIFERDDSINLILMDKEMPVMDGLSATREIRRIEQFEKRSKPMPIIALTAAAMSGDKEECLAAGCNAYLSKPMNREKLYDILTEYL